MGQFRDKNASKKDLERFNIVYTSLGAVQDDREGTRSIQNRGVRCQGPRVPGRFRSKRGTAWDQGVPADSRSFQHGPGATGTQGVPDRPKTELKRRGVQNLADAIAKAESLIDYSNHKESTSKPKDQKEGQAKVWRDRSPHKETHRDNTPLRHKESSPWKGKAKDAQGLRKP
ncbi:hypothetical protein V6N13_080388 [Hibiscus sabdariffa]